MTSLLLKHCHIQEALLVVELMRDAFLLLRIQEYPFESVALQKVLCALQDNGGRSAFHQIIRSTAPCLQSPLDSINAFARNLRSVSLLAKTRFLRVRKVKRNERQEQRARHAVPWSLCAPLSFEM